MNNKSFLNDTKTDVAWLEMTHEQKNHQLFLKQKELLDQFLETDAISQAQHNQSLHDIEEKMGELQKAND